MRDPRKNPGTYRRNRPPGRHARAFPPREGLHPAASCTIQKCKDDSIPRGGVHDKAGRCKKGHVPPWDRSDHAARNATGHQKRELLVRRKMHGASDPGSRRNGPGTWPQSDRPHVDGGQNTPRTGPGRPPIFGGFGKFGTFFASPYMVLSRSRACETCSEIPGSYPDIADLCPGVIISMSCLTLRYGVFQHLASFLGLVPDGDIRRIRHRICGSGGSPEIHHGEKIRHYPNSCKRITVLPAFHSQIMGTSIRRGIWPAPGCIFRLAGSNYSALWIHAGGVCRYGLPG